MSLTNLPRDVFLFAWTAVCGLVLVPACFGADRQAKFDYFPIPTQTYAVVDMSGSSTTTDVSMLALADGNTAAFAFQTTDNNCKSYLWQNGAATLAQSFALTGYGHFYEGNGDDIIYPGFVTTTGEVEGGFYGYWPTDSGGNYIDGTFYATGNKVTAPIGLTGNWTAESLGLAETADGRFGDFAFGYGDGNFNGLGPCGILEIGGVNTLFIDQDDLDASADNDQPISIPGWKVVGVPDVDGGGYADTFLPEGINGLGCAIGAADYGSSFWDRTNLIPLDGQVVALNEQNDVIGVETAADGTYSGYLWQNGTKTELSDLLSTQERAEINNIQPILLSNQVQPGTGVPVQPVLHIVFTGSIRRSAKTQTREAATFLLRKLSDGTCDLHEIVGLKNPPAYVNTSGVLAMIGNPQTTAYTPGTNHALLLSPVILTNLADPAKMHNNKDTQVTFKQNDQDANLNCVAWLAADDPVNNHAPRMPQLQARLTEQNGLNGCSIYWKIQVIFHDRFGNSHRDFDTGPVQNTSVAEDTVVSPQIPTNSSDPDAGWKKITDGTPWNIYQDPDWTTAANQRFFGGDVILSLKIKDANGNMILSQQDYKFRIAGENPNPNSCESYINGLYNGPTPNWSGSDPTSFSGFWFTYAIAKSETAGNGGRLFYNQFLDDGAMHQGPASSAPVPLKMGKPTWNNDGLPDPTSGSGGYGLFQLTYDSTDPNFKMPRSWIWNWQSNCMNVLAEFQQKLGINRDYIAYVKTLYANVPDPSSQTVKIGHTTLNFWESSIITLYNGASVNLKQVVTLSNRKKVTHHHIGAWSYSPSSGWRYQQNSQNYLTKVVENGIETPTQ